MIDAIMSGIGGALKGGVDAFTWQQEYGQKERALDSRNQIEQLKLDVRTMLAELAESGKNERWATPSGNVQAQQTGANDRAAGVQEGQDRRLDVVEQGRNQRWFEPSGNAVLGSETARRGQDMTSSTARRGQDFTAGTARRGQDLTFKTGEMRDFTTQRGQDMSAATAAAGQDTARTIAGMPARASGSGVNFYDRPAGQTPVTTTRPSVPGAPPIVAPGGGAPSAGNDQAEASRLIAAFDTEKDPAKKAELQRQMQAVLARLRGGK
jgi:hypothetical protein